jgi:hypothetical protein
MTYPLNDHGIFVTSRNFINKISLFCDEMHG